jgi:hypothetical protein
VRYPRSIFGELMRGPIELGECANSRLHWRIEDAPENRRSKMNP